MSEALGIYIVGRWSPWWVLRKPRIGLLFILDSTYGPHACISFPFLVLLYDMYMFLVSICLAHVPCFITSHVTLCTMYLYVLICHVMLCTCGYCYVLVYDDILYMLMLMLMLHPNIHFTLYSLSQYHLASTLARSDPTGFGFSTFHRPLRMGFIGGWPVPQVHNRVSRPYAS